MEEYQEHLCGGCMETFEDLEDRDQHRTEVRMLLLLLYNNNSNSKTHISGSSWRVSFDSLLFLCILWKTAALGFGSIRPYSGGMFELSGQRLLLDSNIAPWNFLNLPIEGCFQCFQFFICRSTQLIGMRWWRECWKYPDWRNITFKSANSPESWIINSYVFQERWALAGSACIDTSRRATLVSESKIFHFGSLYGSDSR